jgi:putative endonuclease
MSGSRLLWTLYLIRCGDGSLYTGITTDVERRLREHGDENGSGKGAKFLRGRQPLALVYQIQLQNRSEAQQLEYKVKRLSKIEKESLVKNEISLPELFARRSAS